MIDKQQISAMGGHMKRESNGSFSVGNKGGPGRPKGSRNRSRLLADAIEKVWGGESHLIEYILAAVRDGDGALLKRGFEEKQSNINIKANGAFAKFSLGDLVRKTKGSRWQGKVVGTYSTSLTPEGYAVESDTEHGSVQIYPVSALELVK